MSDVGNGRTLAAQGDWLRREQPTRRDLGLWSHVGAQHRGGGMHSPEMQALDGDGCGGKYVAAHMQINDARTNSPTHVYDSMHTHTRPQQLFTRTGTQVADQHKARGDFDQLHHV